MKLRLVGDRMNENDFLLRAIEISKLAPGGKNFRVGAVIVSNGDIISEGYSWENGIGTHAEENAFQKVPFANIGEGVIYCSMAPCTSRLSGKESCFDRIKRYGIRKVVYACIAPDEKIPSSDSIELIHIKGLEELAKSINPHIF